MAVARGVRAQSTNEAVVYFGKVDQVTLPQEPLQPTFDAYLVRQAATPEGPTGELAAVRSRAAIRQTLLVSNPAMITGRATRLNLVPQTPAQPASGEREPTGSGAGLWGVSDPISPECAAASPPEMRA